MILVAMWMEIMARDGMNCQSKVTHSDTNTKKNTHGKKQQGYTYCLT